MAANPRKSLDAFCAGEMSPGEFLSKCARCATHRDAFEDDEYREAVYTRMGELFHADDIFVPIVESLMSEERVQVAVADMMAADHSKTPCRVVSWLVGLCSVLLKPQTENPHAINDIEERQRVLNAIQEEVNGKICTLDRHVLESFELQNRLRSQADRIQEELGQQKEVERKQMDNLEMQLIELSEEENRILKRLEEIRETRMNILEEKQTYRRSISSIDRSVRELVEFYNDKVSAENDQQRVAATSKTLTVLVQSHCNSVQDALRRLLAYTTTSTRPLRVEDDDATGPTASLSNGNGNFNSSLHRSMSSDILHRSMSSDIRRLNSPKPLDADSAAMDARPDNEHTGSTSTTHLLHQSFCSLHTSTSNGRNEGMEVNGHQAGGRPVPLSPEEMSLNKSHASQSSDGSHPDLVRKYSLASGNTSDGGEKADNPHRVLPSAEMEELIAHATPL